MLVYTCGLESFFLFLMQPPGCSQIYLTMVSCSWRLASYTMALNLGVTCFEKSPFCLYQLNLFPSLPSPLSLSPSHARSHAVSQAPRQRSQWDRLPGDGIHAPLYGNKGGGGGGEGVYNQQDWRESEALGTGTPQSGVCFRRTGRQEEDGEWVGG